MKLFAAAALAAGFAAPASAFDNTSCKDFLTGSWTLTAEREIGGAMTKIESASTYSADGTFSQVVTMTAAGGAPQNMSRNGTWDAAPGSRPDTCLAKVTPSGETESTLELTVIDGDTVASPDGLHSKRVPN